MCIRDRIYGTSETADMSVSTNWKTAKELYYDADGNIDINKGYVCLLYTSRCV